MATCAFRDTRPATARSTIWQVHGDDARAMTLRLLEACEAIRLVPPSGSVALKPNLVLADVAEHGAVTHPGVVSGCIEYFRAHDVRDISVIESSWIGDNTMRALRRAGYEDLCRHHNVPFFDLKRDVTRSVGTAIGPMDICERALDAGLLVVPSRTSRAVSPTARSVVSMRSGSPSPSRHLAPRSSPDSLWSTASVATCASRRVAHRSRPT